MNVFANVENRSSDYDDCCNSKNRISECQSEGLETISDENILDNFDYIEVKSDIKIKKKLADESEDQKPFVANLDNNFAVTNTIDSQLCLKTELNEEFIIKDAYSESDKEILPRNSKRKFQHELSDSTIPKYSKIPRRGFKVLPEVPKDITEFLAKDIKLRFELIKSKTINNNENGKTVEQEKVVTQDEKAQSPENQNGDVLPTSANIASGSNFPPFERTNVDFRKSKENVDQRRLTPALDDCNFLKKDFQGCVKCKNKFFKRPFGGRDLNYYVRGKFLFVDSDVKPNICDVCKKTFSATSKLIRHFNPLTHDCNYKYR